MDAAEVLAEEYTATVAANLYLLVGDIFQDTDIAGLDIEGDHGTHGNLVSGLKRYYDTMRKLIPDTLTYVVALENKIGTEEAKAIRDGLDGDPIMFDPIAMQRTIEELTEKVEANEGTIEEATENIETIEAKANEAMEAIENSGIENVDLDDLKTSVETMEGQLQDFDPDDMVCQDELRALEGTVEDVLGEVDDNSARLKLIMPTMKDVANAKLARKLMDMIKERDGDEKDEELVEKMIAMVREGA